MEELKRQIPPHRRPRTPQEGEIAYTVPRKFLRTRHETALTIALITHRRLFGRVYRGLQPEYFDTMPADSGVFLCPLVPTEMLAPHVSYPGDIDLLIVPYEGDLLQLHRIVAVEIKVLRGSFARQGRSPNDFGLSQATALQAMGFPYAALVHLIVSDESPSWAWREIGIARVLDQNGLVEMLPSAQVDWLPIDLMNRTFGRLRKVVPETTGIGLASVFIGQSDDDIVGAGKGDTLWLPKTRPAVANESMDRPLLQAVGDLLLAKPRCFLDAPRYDPT